MSVRVLGVRWGHKAQRVPVGAEVSSHRGGKVADLELPCRYGRLHPASSRAASEPNQPLFCRRSAAPLGLAARLVPIVSIIVVRLVNFVSLLVLFDEHSRALDEFIARTNLQIS